MKVFFLSSNCTNKLWGDYKKITKVSHSLKCQVIDDFVYINGAYTDQLPDKKIQQRARQITKEIINSDALIYEGTVSSSGGGYYLAIALREKIPVLFLAQQRYTGLLLSEPNSLLQIKQYDANNPNEIKKILVKFLAFAGKKRMSIRYNLMINEEINKFLDQNIKKNKMSKADYIRNLIFEKMKQKNNS